MKATELRQSILQAAVQGKLVPQDLHDEPASELLERIRAEKGQLVKEGKIKKEKPLPPIIENEIPYDVPDGWIWCRLGDIALLITSGSRGWAKYYADSGAIFLRMGNLSKDSYRLRMDSIQYVAPPQNSEGERTKLEPNDVLISITGEVGNLGLIPQELGEAYINQHTALVRFPAELQNHFFPNAFLSPLCQEQFNAPQRGIKNSFRLTDLSYMLVPIPPLAEQQRIVAKVGELMMLCDELEAAENELEALETHFIEYLPKSILQMAVQGKLVPQDLHDEPATELLERIRAEKARLVKEGKLKKEKPLPPITEDEIPYDLPEGWVWCRLGDIIQLLSGRDLETKQINDKRMGIPYITGASAIVNNQILINRWTERAVVLSEKGDLFVSCKGTVGKTIFNEIGDCHIARQIMALRFPYPNVNRHYIHIFIKSYVQQLIIQAKSIIPGISRDDIQLALMPLPPQAEQQRIVLKVNELMALCEDLKTAKTNPVKAVEQKFVPFPQTAKPEEEIGLVARGDAEDLPREALDDLTELFGDGKND